MAQYGEGVYGEGVYGVGESSSYGTGIYGDSGEYGHPVSTPVTKSWIPADPNSIASPIDDIEVHLDASLINKANKWRPSAGESLLQVNIDGRALVEGSLSKYVGLTVNVSASSIVYSDLSASAIKEVSASSVVVGAILDALPSTITFGSAKAAFILRPAEIRESASHNKLTYIPDGKPSRASSAMIKALVYSDGHNQAVSSGISKAAINIPGVRQVFQAHAKESITSVLNPKNSQTHTKAAIDNVLLLPDLRFISSGHFKSSYTGIEKYLNVSEHIKTTNSPVKLYEWYVLEDTPEGYWKLDDHPSTGVVIDSSGNGHHGEIVRYSDFVGTYTTEDGVGTVRIIANPNDASSTDEVLGLPSILNGYPSSAGSTSPSYSKISPNLEVFPDPIDIYSSNVEWMFSESYSYESWISLDVSRDWFNPYASTPYAYDGNTTLIQTPGISMSLGVNIDLNYVVPNMGTPYIFQTFQIYVDLLYKDIDLTHRAYILDIATSTAWNKYLYELNDYIIIWDYVDAVDNGIVTPVSDDLRDYQKAKAFINAIETYLNNPIHIVLTHDGTGDAGTKTIVYWNGEIIWEDIYVKDIESPDNLPLGPVGPFDSDPPRYFSPPREVDHRYPKFVLGPSTGSYMNTPTNSGNSHILSITGEDQYKYLAAPTVGYWNQDIRVGHIAYYRKVLPYYNAWTHYAAGSGKWSDVSKDMSSQEHIKLLPYTDPNEQLFSVHEKIPYVENPNRRLSFEATKASILISPEELSVYAANAVIALTNSDKSNNSQEHLKLVSSSYEDSKTSQSHGKFLFTINPNRITYQEHAKTTVSGHIKQVFQTHIKVGTYAKDGWYESSAHSKQPILLQQTGEVASSYVKASIYLLAESIQISSTHSKMLYSDTEIHDIASSVVSRVAIKFQAFNTVSHEQAKIAHLGQALGVNAQEHVKSSVNAPGKRMNIQEHAKISETQPLPIYNTASSAIITLTNVSDYKVSSARLVSAMSGVPVTSIGSAHTKTITFSVVFGRTSSAHYKSLVTLECREEVGAAHLKYATPAPDSLGRRRGWGLLL